MSSNQSSNRNSEDSTTRDDSQTGEHVAAEDKSTFYSFIKTVASFTGDLSQLTCPGFLLCGTSIIEYCAEYADHPSLFKDIATAKDPLERTVAVTRWFLSTLYGSFRSRCKDSFEKKPYNPVLGEKFICSVEDGSGEKLNVRCEQVSHHPPVSAIYIESPKHGVYINGHCGQKSKFKGTTIKVDQVGHITINLVDSDECLIVTLPSMHIRSLITGRPFLDLFGESHVYSSAGYVATIIYQQKPWFGGDYFGIEGHIKDNNNTVLKTISGKWTEEYVISDKKADTKLVFNPESVPASTKLVSPLEDQGALESQKLWCEVSQAIKTGDYSLATKKKTEIEEAQRSLRKERLENNVVWHPEYFAHVEDEPQFTKVQSAFKSPLAADKSSWHYKDHLKSKQ